MISKVVQHNDANLLDTSVLIKTFRETLEWIDWPTFSTTIKEHGQRHGGEGKPWYRYDDVTRVDADQAGGSHVFSSDKH